MWYLPRSSATMRSTLGGRCAGGIGVTSTAGLGSGRPGPALLEDSIVRNDHHVRSVGNIADRRRRDDGNTSRRALGTLSARVGPTRVSVRATATGLGYTRSGSARSLADCSMPLRCSQSPVIGRVTDGRAAVISDSKTRDRRTSMPAKAAAISRHKRRIGGRVGGRGRREGYEGGVGGRGRS